MKGNQNIELYFFYCFSVWKWKTQTAWDNCITTLGSNNKIFESKLFYMYISDQPNRALGFWGIYKLLALSCIPYFLNIAVPLPSSMALQYLLPTSQCYLLIKKFLFIVMFVLPHYQEHVCYADNVFFLPVLPIHLFSACHSLVDVAYIFRPFLWF